MITYYKQHKLYLSRSFFSPAKGRTASIMEIQDVLNIVLSLEDAGLKSANEIHSPTLYLCRNKSLLRLNHLTYINVSMSSEEMAVFKRCSEIPITISDDNGVRGLSANIAYVLRLPEVLDIMEKSSQESSQSLKPAKLDIPKKMDLDNDCDDDFDDDDFISHNRFDYSDDCGKTILPRRDPSTDATNVKHYIGPSREAFLKWIARSGNRIAFEYTNGVPPFVFAICGRSGFLVSFFDSFDETFWLADDSSPCDDLPSYWFADNYYKISPLHSVALAAVYLERTLSLKVTPMAIIGNNIEVINLHSIRKEWKVQNVSVCRAGKKIDGVLPFKGVIENTALKTANKLEDDDIEHAVAALKDFVIMD